MRCSKCFLFICRFPQLIFKSSLKLRAHKCTIDAECRLDFTDSSSLIRHEKEFHGYFRKEKVYRPVEPSARKARARKPNNRETATNPTHVEVAAIQSFESYPPTPYASSSSSTSSDNGSSYFSPSPSPDLPSPGACQWEYPQQSIYPDRTSTDGANIFNPTYFDPLLFDSLQDLSLSGPFAPEFMQGCSATPSLFSPIESDAPEMSPPFVSDMTSFGDIPSPPVPFDMAAMDHASQAPKAKEEWASLFPEPAELQSHSSTASMPFQDGSMEGSGLNFDLCTATIDFDQIMRDIGVEDMSLQPLGFF